MKVALKEKEYTKEEREKFMKVTGKMERNMEKEF